MAFPVVCLIGIFSTVPFGVALLLAPESSMAFSGVPGWNPGTLHVAPLFGVAFLYQGAFMFSVRRTTDSALRRTLPPFLCAVCVIGAVASAEALASGAVNAPGWTTVAVYGFLALAWVSVGIRERRPAGLVRR